MNKLEDKVEALTSMMREFTVKGRTQQAKACGIRSLDHMTESCPQLQEDSSHKVNAIGFKTKTRIFKEGMTYTPTFTIWS